MLTGQIDDLPEPLTRLSTTGLLSGEPPATVERWIDSASGAGLIRVSSDEYRTLSLTSLGRDVMAGRIEDVQMTMPVVRAPRERRRKTRSRRGDGRRNERDRPSPSTADAGTFEKVFEALRRWRLDQSRERGMPPFVIMHDRTLEAIATSLPHSLDELSDVPGIGPTKLTVYGDAILSVIASAATAGAQ
jgi:ATP-dependent DNA helicase RecQ